MDGCSNAFSQWGHLCFQGFVVRPRNTKYSQYIRICHNEEHVTLGGWGGEIRRRGLETISTLGVDD